MDVLDDWLGQHIQTLEDGAVLQLVELGEVSGRADDGVLLE